MKKQGLVYAAIAFVWLMTIMSMLGGGFPLKQVDGFLYLTTGMIAYVSDWEFTLLITTYIFVMSVVVYFSVSRKWSA